MSKSGNILLSVTNWDPAIWIDSFKAHAPERNVVTERTENDPSIEYALVWKQKPGSLTNLPNLKVIFSLGLASIMSFMIRIFRTYHWYGSFQMISPCA